MTRRDGHFRVQINRLTPRLVRKHEIENPYKTYVYDSLKEEFPFMDFDYESLHYDSLSKCWYINTDDRRMIEVPVMHSDKTIYVLVQERFLADYNRIDEKCDYIRTAFRTQYPELCLDKRFEIVPIGLTGIYRFRTVTKKKEE